MPKAAKGGSRIIHPNSRKAAQLSRKASHDKRVQKRTHERYLKVEELGEKLHWFQTHLDDKKNVYSKNDVSCLIEEYLHRFDEELEQIELINSVKGRKGNNHLARKDNITMILKREQQEFTNGFELPDLTSKKMLDMFREWKGEMRYTQNFVMKEFTRCSESYSAKEWAEKKPKAPEESATKPEKTDAMESMETANNESTEAT